MRTIKVTPDPQINDDWAINHCQLRQKAGREIADPIAAFIAGRWQSPRMTTLAGLESGAEVDALALHKEVSETIWEYYRLPGVSDDQRLMLDMLGTWSLSKLREPEPTEEHTILVAFSVTEKDRTAAQRRLLPALQSVLESNGGPAESWWIAEDDRIDGSDNDSAVFVPMGAQEQVSSALYRNFLTPEHNVVHRTEDES
jgi:hypothetical protein